MLFPDDVRRNAFAYLKRYGISYTTLASHSRCRMLSAYQLNRWRVIKSSISRVFGGALHDSLGEFLFRCYSEKIRSLPDILAAAQEMGEISGRNFIRKNSRDAWGEDEAQRMETLAAYIPALTRGFAKRFPDRIRKWSCIVPPETQFRIPVSMFYRTGDWFERLELTGRIDIGLSDRGTGIMTEFKSFGYIDPSAPSCVSFDPQSMFYILLARAHGFDFDKIWFVFVKRPELRQGKKETYPEFIQRMLENVQERLDFYFQSEDVSPSPEELDRQAVELSSQLHALYKWLRGENETIRTRDAYTCRGRFTCDFVSACGDGCDPSLHPGIYYQSKLRATKRRRLAAKG